MRDFEKQGFFVVPQQLSCVEMLLQCLKDVKPNPEYPQSLRYRKDKLYAIRNLLQISPQIKNILRHTFIKDIVESLCGERAVIIHSLFFDKIHEANFHVPFHQDVVMPYRDDSATKIVAGVSYKQLPCEILQQLVAVRIHLDDNDEDNGPLEVVAGSHNYGVLSDAEIKNRTTPQKVDTCVVQCGGVVVMRPLLLHSSKRSLSLDPRRVLHLVFSPDLPEERWFFRESLDCQIG